MIHDVFYLLINIYCPFGGCISFIFRQPELNYMTQEEENFARNFARFINEANIIDISNLFEESKRFIAQNANPKIVFFDLALKNIVLLIRK